jgi:H+/Cl- antiporter ClcA
MLVLLLTALAGTRVYLGISTDLMYGALTGAAGIAAAAFAWKLIFTATSLGTGFVGGEMFPLFIIGALTGAQFARVTDASVAASVLSVAVLRVAVSSSSAPPSSAPPCRRRACRRRACRRRACGDSFVM